MSEDAIFWMIQNTGLEGSKRCGVYYRDRIALFRQNAIERGVRRIGDDYHLQSTRSTGMGGYLGMGREGMRGSVGLRWGFRRMEIKEWRSGVRNGDWIQELMNLFG